jgi:hypothetical protein
MSLGHHLLRALTSRVSSSRSSSSSGGAQLWVPLLASNRSQSATTLRQRHPTAAAQHFKRQQQHQQEKQVFSSPARQVEVRVSARVLVCSFGSRHQLHLSLLDPHYLAAQQQMLKAQAHQQQQHKDKRLS